MRKMKARRRLDALLQRSSDALEARTAVLEVLQQVQKGDVAVLAYQTLGWTRGKGMAQLRIGPRPCAKWQAPANKLMQAMESAHERIAAFHRQHLPRSGRWRTPAGCLAEVRPLPRVGIYVPGGQAAYLNGDDERRAGALGRGGKIIMVTPAVDGVVSDAVGRSRYFRRA